MPMSEKEEALAWATLSNSIPTPLEPRPTVEDEICSCWERHAKDLWPYLQRWHTARAYLQAKPIYLDGTMPDPAEYRPGREVTFTVETLDSWPPNTWSRVVGRIDDKWAVVFGPMPRREMGL